VIGELASRLSGSSDIFERGGRGPTASINFITAHDGFTLEDLVSYERKRNEANQEGNRDGPFENLSRNWGVEGPATSSRIIRLRQRLKRNFLATLLLSQGVPMLLGGDELGRSQLGNNNAYSQDNETSWLNWDLTPEARELVAFVRRAAEIRRDHPSLARETHFTGRRDPETGLRDVMWIRPDGREMADEDWRDEANQVLGMWIPGDDHLLLLVNGGTKARPFALPVIEKPGGWEELLSTAEPPAPARIKGHHFNLAAHSLAFLRFGAGPSAGG
jgi:isoamylase